MEKVNMWFTLSVSMLAAFPVISVVPLSDQLAVVGVFHALSSFFYSLAICGEILVNCLCNLLCSLCVDAGCEKSRS